MNKVKWKKKHLLDTDKPRDTFTRIQVFLVEAK